MKYEIRKMQQGGGFATFTPILESAPVAPSGTKQSSSKEDDDNSQEIVNKSIYNKLINQGGLVNDVNYLVDKLSAIQSKPLAYLDQNNISSSLEIIKELNKVSEQKKLWESTYNIAKEQGGLGEVALDGIGRMFVKSKDGFKTVSVEEYKKNKNKYNPMSVNELYTARQFDPALTYNSSVFESGASSIGMTKIVDKVKNLFSVIKEDVTKSEKHYSSSELKSSLSALQAAKNPTEDQKVKIAQLQNILETPGEYYKIVNNSKSKEHYIEVAKRYAYESLTTQEKNKLNAVAAIQGISPEQYLMDSLVSNLSGTETEQIIAPEKSTKEEEGSKKTIALSPQELIHTDRLYKPGTYFELNNGSGTAKIRMVATGVGPLLSLTKEGDVIEPSIVSNILTKGNYASIVDPRQAYIGDTQVDPALLNEVAYTGEGMHKVYMPVKPDGTPDLAEMERFKDAYEVFDINKDHWSTKEAEEFFNKKGFKNVKVQENTDSQGGVTKAIVENQSVKPFLALPIITNSGSDLSENPWMIELSGDQKKAGETLMKEAFSVVTGTAAKPKIVDKSPSGWFTSPYKGTIFMAYRPDANAMLMSMKGHISGKPATETDIYRNLNYSSNTNQNIGASASVLK